MSDQVDVIGEILDEMQRITNSGEKVSSIVIHEAGLWTRLADLAGADLERGPTGSKLFNVPVTLGSKSDTAKFTVKSSA